MMSILGDLRVLKHLLWSPIRGNTHAQRLESFYAAQADDYDRFRQRLLHGREELWELLPIPEGGVWADLGAGTGSSLDYAASALPAIRSAYLVDLSPSLLDVARRRIERLGRANLHTVHADVTSVVLPEKHVDLVTFSYSLTMIPDWFAAIDHACSLLRPGGHVGVVDFYVSRKHPCDGRQRHGWLRRTFWPIWFAGDNVFLSPDHLPYLLHRFEVVAVREAVGSVPYMPGMRVPYYIFVGRKRGQLSPVLERGQ